MESGIENEMKSVGLEMAKAFSAEKRQLHVICADIEKFLAETSVKEDCKIK